MGILLPYRLIALAALVLGLGAGALAYHHHVFEQGVAQERARRDVIDAANNAKAEAERLRLNGLVAKAQAALDTARTKVDQLQAEVDHEKTVSSDRQQRLLAGTERERVLIRAIGPSQAGASGQAQSTGTDTVDQAGSTTAATLDGRVASDLEWARATRNTSLDALKACIVQYDALKTAVDTTP